MKDFKEFQLNWLLFAVGIPIQVLLNYLYFNKVGSDPIDSTGFITINITFLLIDLLFYGMTTSMTASFIVISFGIGLVRKKIDIKRIKNAETIVNPWYYGWGIRVIPNGMLYNISGTAGIKLNFHDTNRVIDIGSGDSTRLKEEISKRISGQAR